MRILHIASGDLWAGAEAMLFELATAQDAIDSVTVRVILLNNGILRDKLKEQGIAVTVLDEHELSFVRILSRCARLCSEFRPDIVHSHREKENLLGGICALLNRETLSVRTLHGDLEQSDAPILSKAWLKCRLDILVCRHLQSVCVCVSEDLKERVSDRFSGSNLAVIRNGIRIRATANNGNDVVDPNSQTVRILFAARLVPLKRVDLFLSAAKAIIEQGHEDVHFSVAGDGPELDSCRKYVHENRLERHVGVLGFQSDMDKVLESQDMLVIASDHEGLPMILLEAMSRDVLVVARAIGDIPFVLDHGKCGVLWDLPDDDLHDVLLRTARNQPKMKELVSAARRRVAAEFSSSRVAQRYIELYANLSRGSLAP